MTNEELGLLTKAETNDIIQLGNGTFVQKLETDPINGELCCGCCYFLTGPCRVQLMEKCIEEQKKLHWNYWKEVKVKQARKRLSLREFIHTNNYRDEDIDVEIDGTETYMCICFGDIRLTPEGEKEFGECLDKLYMDGLCITCDDDDAFDDYFEGKGIVYQGEKFVHALNGDIASSLYERWFEGPDAVLI